MWTHFWDMHSGGGQKLDWAHIYIEAPETEARVIFYNRFDRNPERVTCTCCGSDYSISEGDDIAQVTAYHRGAKWSDDAKRYIEEQDDSILKYCRTQAERDYEMQRRPLLTVEQYEQRPDVLFVRASDIAARERVGEVPEEGYVWR